MEKNNNNTSTNANDDYYQLAVKQENEWTDFWTGQKNSDVSWQIYAVEDDGQINWEKTIWTQSISGFETFFGTDLDEDGVSGINSSDLAFAPLDQYGYRLKKDEDNLLYIVDSNDENTISISDEYGGFPSFDWSHNWGSGSHNSSAVAVEQNSDNTFSLAVKHEDTWDGETHLNWEILSISSEGVLNWNNTVWTEDISLYEKTIFNDDLDEDGSKGVNLEALVSVTTDTTGAQLKSDSLEQRYYIQDGDKTVGVSHLWGGWIDFSQNEAWGTSTFVREPLAVEAHSFKSSEGENVAGYIVATKNARTHGARILNSR